MLSILAATVVAVTFEWAYRRAARLAKRLAGGHRVSPYDVLARFSEQMAAAYSSSGTLPLMARLLTEDTAAAQVEVFQWHAGRFVWAARWPEEAQPLASIEPDGTELRISPGATWSVPVRHRGDLLGALVARTASGRPPTRRHRRLLVDLAVQVGLVLRNVALIDELNASRQRLVAAQDAERRRLEHAIRDRVGGRLAAVSVQLSALDCHASNANEQEMLGVLRSEAQEAQRELSALSRGVYPALLTDKGPAAALAAQAGVLPVRIEIHAGQLDRHPQEIEAAVYFCCLEALQNVVKHAEAHTAVVRLWAAASRLHFSVRDDGAGFDPGKPTSGSGIRNIADRLETLGGRLDIRSSPALGTSITGWLPVAARQPTP